MKNALEVSHLTKDYGSFKLDDVSFTVPGGTIMGLIGENGAGKSTTIKCILNLVRRDGGEIQVLGLDNLADERAVKAQVGVVLDETTFHDGLSAPQVGSILARLYPGWDGALYQHYLEKFGLTSKKLVKTFSKGMKMKLSLAAAFAARPRLLILDEATSGLDPVVPGRNFGRVPGVHSGRGARHSPVQPHHQRSGEGGRLCDLPPQGAGGGVGGQG